MANKVLISILGLLSIVLSGCAHVVPMPTQENSMPPQMKSVDYYKTHLNDVIKKAEANDINAQVELVFAYGNTWYGVEDLDKHLFWLENAASQDNIPALCALSYKYFTGFRRIPVDMSVANKLSDKAYQTYTSKPMSDWSTYDTYMISGALLTKGVYAKTKELSKKYICLAKSLGVKDENRIYMINKRMREKGITCD